VKIPSFITGALARKLGVPDLSVRMFRAATELSGLDKSTLPVELLPLNSIQLSRGLLNFTVLQTLDRWVLPYWAERQYDPGSRSFVPRSHYGLSINVTHRNWTAVGNLSCSIEPIVDPRGLVTPFRNMWSIDSWFRSGRRTTFPSRTDDVEQSLYHSLPIVLTTLPGNALQGSTKSFTSGGRFIQHVAMVNNSTEACDGSFALAVRPFNPEGVALIHTLTFDQDRNAMVINNDSAVHSSRVPSRVLFGNLEIGDTAWMFEGSVRTGLAQTIECPAGLANGVMEFFVALGPHEQWECDFWCDLEPGDKAPLPSIEQVAEHWQELMSDGLHCRVPDDRITNVLAASHASLLMTIDDTVVTPGPATYHYFWFRDAAYILLALDCLGHGSMTRKVVSNYPALQDSTGMFRSQQGEWDSTGQAIWSMWHHALLTHDPEILKQHFTPLWRGVRWIDSKRERECTHSRKTGLMPRGLSAEHLGLADVYFWDTFWSLAGLEAFVRICEVLSKPDEELRTRALASIMRADLDRSISETMLKEGIDVIPAGPNRRADAGMVGSIAAWYPLQLFSPDHAAMRATVTAIESQRFIQGLFYQPIVHSGLNAYLSLQVAQALLFAGDTNQFWKILQDVTAKASPTYCFPEAIHPSTGGGSMGDGHHAWASAEVVLALRNAFVMERWPHTDRRHSLILLGGIPPGLLSSGKELFIENAVVPEGKLNLTVTPGDDQTIILIDFQKSGFVPEGSWYLSVPPDLDLVSIDGNPLMPMEPRHPRNMIPLLSKSQRIELRRCKG
jgi:hypothetical protein